MQYVIDTLYNVEVTSVLDEHMSLLCARHGEAHNISVKIESDPHTMKQVLYDTGNLTVASWLLQRALKFKPPI